MRKPAGTGFCWLMISFTLATALGDRVTGAAFLVTSGLVTAGIVVVAIGISLALKLFDYSKSRFHHKYLIQVTTLGKLFPCLDAATGRKSHSSRPCNRLRTKGLIQRRGLANRSIIIPVRAFPGTGCGVLRAPTTKWKACTWVWNLPRWFMTLLTVVAVVFGIFAIGLILLLIYKSTLTMHEDDQLFLDDNNSHMQEEQTELLVKVNRLTIPVRVFSIGSGVFLLVLVGMLIYQKLNEVQ